MTALRIGTRASALARWQTEHVVARLRAGDPALRLEVREIASDGDAFPETPIEAAAGAGFFTSTLERALLADEIDLAVHSFKDLPVEGSSDLVVAAVPPRGAVEDVLCARDGRTLATLPPGARVGTSSARRGAQLRARRADLRLEPLRGNVPTRIAHVTAGRLDAVVLARAGLERLGLAAHITEVFPASAVLPAPAQGALAIQTRRGSPRIAALAVLEDAATRRTVEAERAVLHALGGGCAVPVGALATVTSTGIALEAGVFDPDGARMLRTRVEGADPMAVGALAARRLLAAGAGEILAAFGRGARVEET